MRECLQAMDAHHEQGDICASGLPGGGSRSLLDRHRHPYSSCLEHVWHDQLRRRDGISVVGR